MFDNERIEMMIRNVLGKYYEGATIDDLLRDPVLKQVGRATVEAVIRKEKKSRSVRYRDGKYFRESY